MPQKFYLEIRKTEIAKTKTERLQDQSLTSNPHPSKHRIHRQSAVKIRVRTKINTNTQITQTQLPIDLKTIDIKSKPKNQPKKVDCNAATHLGNTKENQFEGEERLWLT